MTREQQIISFNAMADKMRDTLISKGQDYALEDVLSTFKFTGDITNTSAEAVCLTEIAIKVARLGVLLSTNKKPNHESIQDSILDLANYAFLLNMVMEDKVN